MYSFCIQIVYKRFPKCGIHFVYILYTFYIHDFWSTKSVNHKNYVYNIYARFIEDVYTNNCMQNGSHNSTHFDACFVHFLVNHCTQLRLETCWLSTWRLVSNQWINRSYCIKLPIIKLNQGFECRWMSIDRRSIWTVRVINECYVYHYIFLRWSKNSWNTYCIWN